MAKHLDLEEQEQLDQLKHFWRQYGNLISTTLIVVFGAFAAWNAWQWWERHQSQQAAALYDEVERAARQAEVPKLDRALADMKDRFGGTAYAQQSALLAARVYFEQGRLDNARAALSWVAENASDPGYKSIARLRLAGALVEAKAYDEALKALSDSFPPEFDALAADRRADVYLAQGKRAEAKAELAKAYKALPEQAEYRRLIEVKLNSLGVDPAAAAPAVAASGASK